MSTMMATLDNLQQEILKWRKEVKTNSYSMSIGEIVSLYRDEELDIHPEFQREYRWADDQKSRFIESILLGIPIPPIFVLQKEDGKWEMIDGLQRISTILELMGQLKNEKGEKQESLSLNGTRFLKSLKGKTWNDLDQAQRLEIKRARIDIIILISQSNTEVKYELFDRLNSGGSALTEQEIRNCLLLMVNPDFYNLVKKLSQNKDFKNVIPISERQENEKYDMELVLRWLLFYDATEQEIDELKSYNSLHKYLTDKAIKMAESYKENDDFSNKHEEIFEKLFKFINSQMSEDAFKKYDNTKEKFSGRFSLTAFEAIACGLAYKLDEQHLESIDLKKQVKKLWANLDTFTSSGISGTSRIPETISTGRRFFSNGK